MKTPHDSRAEEILLSCLIDTDEDHTLLLHCLQDGITPEHFLEPKHRVIYSAIIQLHSTEKSVDTLSVIETLKSASQLQICGVSEVSRIAGVAETTGSFETARETVLTKAAQRKALEQARDVVRQLEGDYLSREDVGEAINGQMARINSALKGADRVRSIPTIVDEAEARAEDRISGKTRGNSLTFGIPLFDKIATEIEKHELICIAARPGVGKTSLARQITHSNLKRNRRVAFFVLESSDVSIIESIAAEAAQVSVRGIQQELPEKQRRYAEELERIRGYRNLLRVYDKDLSLAAIEARCKTLKAAWGPDLIVIDYLQIIRYRATGRSRADEIGEITKALVGLTKYCDCPIIIMSQLTRSSERENRQPVLSDLRDSGSIEADCSRCIFIYRPDRNMRGEDQTGDNEEEYLSQLLQRKLRDGPQAALDVTFKSKYATFV